MRVSKTDGSQTNDLQRDALIAAGVDLTHLYEDRASGKRGDRPGLTGCLKALRLGDTLIVWKLDRLGRDLRHLINTVHDLTGRWFEFASANNIGLGGPDVIPNRKAQMKNSYPFFNKYKSKLALIAMAVQEPTLTYRNPNTGKPFSKDEFVQFAEDYLGADIIFWSTTSPWLTKK